MNNNIANRNSAVELPDLFDLGQESSHKRFSWNDIRYYLNLSIRFRWALIVPFCLAMIVGVYYVLTVPPIYEATTLVLVTPPDVPSNIVRPIVSENLQSQISTISQQIQSRSNLEKVIAEFKLFSDPDRLNMFMEDKLTILRKNIKIDLIQSRNAFSISFKSNDPEKTMRVVNTLASNFIEANIEHREVTAVGTTDFLETELEAMRQNLEETESKRGQFRNQYMGELPEQLQANLQILASLESQVNNRQERLRDERNQLLIRQNEVEQIRRELQGGQNVAAPTSGGQPSAGGSVTLLQLRQQLASLQGIYTELHPDVVRLKNRILELESKDTGQNTLNTMLGTSLPAENLQNISSPALREAVKRRMEVESNISNIQMDVNKINQQIAEYRSRIERTHKREEQLLSLNRDYDNIKQAYNSLLSRKVEADMAFNLQRKNKGQQFRIVDFAKMPERPVSPNMVNLFFLFIAAGLGTGVGIVFIYDFFDQSVRKPEVLQARLSLPVLMVMPTMELTPSRGSRMMDWLNNGLSLLGALVSLGLFACLAAVTVLNLPRASEMIKGILK
jgi:polysaccharide chain length determinant protein (PEP-CTERM system associated)